MTKYCPVCKKQYSEDYKFCPQCEDENGMPIRLVEEPVVSGMGVTFGDANAISGGLNLHDSHNVSTVNTVTNNVTNIAPQKSEMEILQDKKNNFLAECKRAFEDGILEPAEEVALEECRIKLGLDEVTAKSILDSVRLLADRNSRKTSLNPIAKTKLKILSDNLQSNNVSAIKDQIKNLEAIVNKYEHDELSRKYFLSLAVLEPKKCIELKESSLTDSYWKSYWSYLAYIKEGEKNKAEMLLAGLDRFADYPEDNMTILAVSGALMSGNEEEAREFLDAVTGDYTPELQRFVDSIYLLLDPEAAKEMGADAFACAFYLVNMFGQKDPKVAAAEEAERKAREEAERLAREEDERKAKEEAERKAREDAERKVREEEEREAREEAEKKAQEEAKRRAKKLAERKAKAEYIQKEAPFTIFVDKVDDPILGVMTARSVFGWGSAEFREKTSSLPASVSTIKGRTNAQAALSKLNNGGLTCHFECEEGFDENDAIYDSDVTICFEPRTKECLDAIDYAFGQNGKELDFAKALPLLKDAASMDDPRALSDYGICMSTGIGMKADKKKSVKYMRKAIELVLPKAQEGGKDSMLFITRCAFIGLIVSQSGSSDFDEMMKYLQDWSDISAKGGNPWSKAIRYYLDDSIDFWDEDYMDNLLNEIKASMSYCPIYADALLFLKTVCDESLSEKRMAVVNKLSKKALSDHLYSNDLVSLIFALNAADGDEVESSDKMLSYYSKLDY